MISRTSRITK